MRDGVVHLLALTGVALIALALGGCASKGGEQSVLVPDMPEELASMLVESVGTSTGEGGFRSPTDEPDMEAVHEAAIATARTVAGQSPEILAFARSNGGAALLLVIVNKAGCPVSKGVLMAAGWTLIQVGTTEQGYRIFGARHEDGRELGLTATAGSTTDATDAGAVSSDPDSGAAEGTDAPAPASSAAPEETTSQPATGTDSQ